MTGQTYVDVLQPAALCPGGLLEGLLQCNAGTCDKTVNGAQGLECFLKGFAQTLLVSHVGLHVADVDAELPGDGGKIHVWLGLDVQRHHVGPDLGKGVNDAKANALSAPGHNVVTTPDVKEILDVAKRRHVAVLSVINAIVSYCLVLCFDIALRLRVNCQGLDSDKSRFLPADRV